MKIKFPKDGKFGEFGGKYIPETLVPAVGELEEAYLKFKNDKEFKKELDYYLREYAGDRKSTRLNSSHIQKSRMPSSA